MSAKKLNFQKFAFQVFYLFSFCTLIERKCYSALLITEITEVPYDLGEKKDWIKHNKMSFEKVEVRTIEQKIFFKIPAKCDIDAPQHSLS